MIVSVFVHGSRPYFFCQQPFAMCEGKYQSTWAVHRLVEHRHGQSTFGQFGVPKVSQSVGVTQIELLGKKWERLTTSHCTSLNESWKWKNNPLFGLRTGTCSSERAGHAFTTSTITTDDSRECIYVAFFMLKHVGFAYRSSEKRGTP